jgi:hypothetical protein
MSEPTMPKEGDLEQGRGRNRGNKQSKKMTKRDWIATGVAIVIVLLIGFAAAAFK